jgi:hypothetical protein
VALEDLDLDGICGTGVDFRLLKNIVSKLEWLHVLILLRSLRIHTTDIITNDDGPRNLTAMTIGGHLDPGAMMRFEWPQNLNDLTISHCENLNTQVLEGILENKILQV